jgi:CheY-like chemotaxis protein
VKTGVVLLVFWLDGVEHALPIESVVEIVRMVAVTPMPEAPLWVSGVINFRGRVISLIDVRLRLGMQMQEPDLSTPIVVVKTGEAVTGLVVDEVVDMVALRREAVDLPSRASSSSSEGRHYDVGVLDLDMPTMNGPDLAVVLHDLPGYRELPLVLLSSRPWGGDRDRAAHFSAQLVKPARPSQLGRALTRAVEAQAAKDASWSDTVPTTSLLRVLVVEDNAVNQKVALAMLRKLGYWGDLAGNGLEALAAVHLRPYDVALMDVQMPEMDGLEATRRIRAELPAERQPTIIAMTANATTDDQAHCEQAGMDSYLAKPVRVGQLAAALADCRPRNMRNVTHTQ